MRVMDTFTITPGIAPHHRHAAAALYWQAFGAKLGRVMGPDTRAISFFEANMVGDFALSAVSPDGALLGIAGFKTHEGSLTGGGLRSLAAEYGWWGALWRGVLLSMLERDLTPDVLLMDGICVAAQARGQGVGSALLEVIIAEAKARDLASVRLDVIDTNPRARALYERKGFVAAGTTHLGPLKALFGFDHAIEMRRDVEA